MEVKLDYWDPHSGSAYEFARQMSSSKLKKINPTFTCTLEKFKDQPGNSTVFAEYIDGSSLTLNTKDMKLSDIRREFYEKAGAIEEAIDLAGGPVPGQDANAATAAGGGKKDGKGKGGKK